MILKPDCSELIFEHFSNIIPLTLNFKQYGTSNSYYHVQDISLVSCLRKLNCQNFHQQICLKHLNVLFLAIKYQIHREKYQNSLVLNFEHFPVSVYRDLLLMELPPALSTD